MKELGNKIAKKRKDLGLTQSEFADRLSVTRQTVGRWETGTALPDIDKISEIASILKVSCDYLLQDDLGEEDSVSSGSGGTSRLLAAMVGRQVKFSFFDEEADVDLYDKACTIQSLEGNWIKISFETKKGPAEKLIPLSSVLSIELV